MSEQDERLARLPLDKRELVQKLLQEQGLSGLLGQSNRAAIRQVPRQQSLPLSFAQQRLWFLHQLDTRNAGYNVPLSIRLSGPLDHGALERSLSELVAHHESLRTSFPAAHGNPSQNIAPPQPAHPYR